MVLSIFSMPLNEHRMHAITVYSIQGTVSMQLFYSLNEIGSTKSKTYYNVTMG